MDREQDLPPQLRKPPSKAPGKINLQIMQGNEAVQAFYASLGYAVEVRVSMGKRVPENIPDATG